MKRTGITLILIAGAVLLAACARSDEQLANDVNERLRAEDITTVTVTVKDGVATLMGEVESLGVKTQAEAAARTVDGISSVDGTGLIAKPKAEPIDPALKTKAEEALRKAGCGGIILTLEEDKVIATGKVAPVKFAECVAIIDQAGLGKMENGLVVGN